MSGQTILIIEDEGIIAEYLRRMLTNFGYKVLDPVSQGEVAVPRALELRPDLLLVDIMLAGKMNGIEAATQIRSQMDIPVIYLSAYAEDALVAQAQTTDPYGYLVKPVQDRELRAAVEVAFHKHALNKQLKESENKFRQVIETASEVFWLRNKETGKMLYISPSYEKVFGRSCNSLYENPLSFLDSVHPDDRREIIDAQRKLTEEGIRFDKEYRIVLPNGSVRWVWARSSPVYDNFGQVYRYSGAAEDITGRKQAELIRESLMQISQLFMANLAMSEIYQQICQILSTHFDFPATSVELYDPDQGIMEFVGVYGLPVSVNFRVPVLQTLSGKVAETGKSIALGQPVEPFALRHEALRQIAVRSFVCVPFMLNEDVQGVISLRSPQDRSDLETIQTTLQIVANHLAQELARKKAEEALHKSYREIQVQYQRLALLREIDKTISGDKGNASRMIRTILDHIQKSLDTERVVLWSPSHDELLQEISAVTNSQVIPPSSSVTPGWEEIFAVRVYNDLQPLFSSSEPGAENQTVLGIGLTHPQVHSFAMLPLLAKEEAKGVLGIFFPGNSPFDENDRVFLQSLATQVAIAIDNAQMHSRVILSDMEVVASHEATLQSWAQTLELRDKETKGHSDRVVDLTLRLAEAMGIPQNQRIHLRRGAILHDIGKMVIPDNVLKKPGKLDEAEWNIMRQHPSYAYQMLAGITFLEPALDIPYCHHEKWDGTGYPRGLKGEEIPLAARLFAVCDVWEALNDDRVYRRKWTPEEARLYLAEQAGKQFDPEIIKIFLEKVLPGLA